MKFEKNFFNVIVCGGRNYENKENVYSLLDIVNAKLQNNNKILNQNTKLKIINGGANGADFLSKCWAKDRGIDIEIFLADWNTYGKYAGPLRNKLMFDSSNPEMIVAFNGGKGTKHMIELALDNEYILEDLTEHQECKILYKY